MKDVRSVAWRYLTDAEFFNLYKPRGTETGGGGQKYIDFKTTAVDLAAWRRFFSGITGAAETRTRAGRPKWSFPIHSTGLSSTPAQAFYIYQRRGNSVCIPRQHLHSRGANRVHAWHPSNGFPEPADPGNRQQLPDGLAVYLVSTHDGEVWAGWFQNQRGAGSPCRDAGARAVLRLMLHPTNEPGDADMLECAAGSLLLDEDDSDAPFLTPTTPTATPRGEGPSAHRRTSTASGTSDTHREQAAPARRAPPGRRQRTEEEIVESLFNEDEELASKDLGEVEERLVTVRRRNQAAIRDLKALYEHECQITASDLTFLKTDGTPYTEAHHLVPLGSDGGDDPRNIIIVSALIHRMLHYADVSEIDLAQIRTDSDGRAELKIQINGEDYSIHWHQRHAEHVARNAQEGPH